MPNAAPPRTLVKTVPGPRPPARGRKAHATTTRARLSGRRLLFLSLALATALGAASGAFAQDRTVQSLNSYLLGEKAWKDGDAAAAAAHWEEACRLDPESVPPKLGLAKALFWTRPTRSIELLRDTAHQFTRQYRLQKWLIYHGILALCVGISVGACLLMLGLIARHLRAVHHTLTEALAWAGRSRSGNALAAGVCLALPLLLDLGPLATLLLWVFLCSFRFSRRERILALGVAAWALLLGPVTLATSPFWSIRPDGRDASLIEEAQRSPLADSPRAAVEAWRAADPEAGVPLYLRALALLETPEDGSALAPLTAAGSHGEIPPPVLHTEMGTAHLLDGDPSRALDEYGRAADLDPGRFEPRYNMSLVQAATGRFHQADEAMETAGRIDLDRLRYLERWEEPGVPRRPVRARWTAPELWSYNLRHPAQALPPLALGAFLPLRSQAWAFPLTLAAVLLGYFAGGRLSRLLRVHGCYQCGRPVCRRCLKRLNRHAYCRRCAESLRSAGAGESTRLLLRRLLEDRPVWRSRGLPILTLLLPGTGATLRGYPETGALAAFLAGLGATLFAFPLWGDPILPVAEEPSTYLVLRLFGGALMLLAIGVSTLGVAAAERRRRSLRVFLERDVDRLAA